MSLSYIDDNPENRHLRWRFYVAKLPGRCVFGKILSEERDNHRRELLQKIQGKQQTKDEKQSGKPRAKLKEQTKKARTKFSRLLF